MSRARRDKEEQRRRVNRIMALAAGDPVAWGERPSAVLGDAVHVPDPVRRRLMIATGARELDPATELLRKTVDTSAELDALIANPDTPAHMRKVAKAERRQAKRDAKRYSRKFARAVDEAQRELEDILPAEELAYAVRQEEARLARQGIRWTRKRGRAGKGSTGYQRTGTTAQEDERIAEAFATYGADVQGVEEVYMPIDRPAKYEKIARTCADCGLPFMGTGGKYCPACNTPATRKARSRAKKRRR